MRTAAAATDLCQARAASRRPVVVAAQREAPEQVPAAVECAQQGCAVFRIGRRNGFPAAVLSGRAIHSLHGIRRQQVPGGRLGPGMHDTRFTV